MTKNLGSFSLRIHSERSHFFRARNKPCPWLVPLPTAPRARQGHLPLRLWGWEQPFPPISVSSLPNFFLLPVNCALPVTAEPLWAAFLLLHEPLPWATSRLLREPSPWAGAVDQCSLGRAKLGSQESCALPRRAQWNAEGCEEPPGRGWDGIRLVLYLVSVQVLLPARQNRPEEELVLLPRSSWGAFSSFSRWFIPIALSPSLSIFSWPFWSISCLTSASLQSL